MRVSKDDCNVLGPSQRCIGSCESMELNPVGDNHTHFLLL